MDEQRTKGSSGPNLAGAIALVLVGLGMLIPSAIIVLGFFFKPASTAPESGLFLVGLVFGSLGLGALGFAWRLLTEK
jgi:hypothetical protein